jgi:hypothetical protein
MSVELFRYRGAARDGGTLEYVFETDELNVPKTVTQMWVPDPGNPAMYLLKSLKVNPMSLIKPSCT